MISIFADGSSSGGSGKPGGYGYVIVQSNALTDQQEILAWSYGGSPATTNNLMELEGVIQGLYCALEMGLHQRGGVLELVSDSQYALGMASGGYTPTKNLDKAAEVRELAELARCRFRWVKGHKGNTYNEMCDKLAGKGKLENTPPELLKKKENKRKARKAKRKALREAAEQE